METILIVEDDRTYARTTANWLVRNGMERKDLILE
jgi:two-component system, NtrC family, response regulator HydG